MLKNVYVMTNYNFLLVSCTEQYNYNQYVNLQLTHKNCNYFIKQKEFQNRTVHKLY